MNEEFFEELRDHNQKYMMRAYWFGVATGAFFSILGVILVSPLLIRWFS